MIEEKKGKNLFEVNGIKYIDNIPKDMRISLTKEQYAEYLQQKELIERLQKENEELRKTYDKTTTEIEQLNNRDIKRLAEIGELRTENSYLKQENEYLNCICESDEDNYINKGKIRELINHYKSEIESENDLLEQRIITKESYKNRINLYNNYIHILEKLLKEG